MKILRKITFYRQSFVYYKHCITSVNIVFLMEKTKLPIYIHIEELLEICHIYLQEKVLAWRVNFSAQNVIEIFFLSRRTQKKL